MPVDHLTHSQCQRDGNHSWQTLRHGSDCQANRKHEHINDLFLRGAQVDQQSASRRGYDAQISAAQNGHGKNEAADCQCTYTKCLAKLVQPFL